MPEQNYIICVTVLFLFFGGNVWFLFSVSGFLLRGEAVIKWKLIGLHHCLTFYSHLHYGAVRSFLLFIYGARIELKSRNQLEKVTTANQKKSTPIRKQSPNQKQSPIMKEPCWAEKSRHRTRKSQRRAGKSRRQSSKNTLRVESLSSVKSNHLRELNISAKMNEWWFPSSVILSNTTVTS